MTETWLLIRPLNPERIEGLLPQPPPNELRLTPAELQSNHFYITSLDTNPWEIIRVGPKWITYREWYAPFGTGKVTRGSERRTLRSGWEGPAFREVPRP